jgi:Fe-S-cluster containining protein
MNAEYGALVAKVDAFTTAAEQRRAADLACRSGCSACCEAWLSVSAVEASEIREALAALPLAQRREVRARGERELRREAEQEPSARCALLDDEGRCSVYESRPLVCRTQGHALRYPPGFVPLASVMKRTPQGDVVWCPLNYGERPPAPEDVLDAERVDQILAVVARRHASAVGIALDHRLTLSLLAAEVDVLNDGPARRHESENARSVPE